MAMENLMTALLLGVLLVVLILAAFLFEWRTAFISLLAIPLSLVGALVILETFGTVINVMILAGLVVAIGVVVDDAIIDVENIVRRLRQARAEGREVSTFRVVLDASVEVRSAIIYATLIDVTAIIPVFFLSGLSGSFFQPLVLAYGLAVLVSMLVATTVTPALCLLLLSRGHRQSESPLMRVLKRGYGAVLARRDAQAASGDRGGGGHDRCRPPRLPDARPVAAAQLQGERPDHVLGDEARHVARGDEADLEPGLPGLPRQRSRPSRSARRTWGRRCSGTRSTA